MRTVKVALLLFIPMVLMVRAVISQTVASPPRITDLFSSEEYKRAGLSKLNPEELAALNAAFLRVLIQLNSNEKLGETTGSSVANGSKDIDFYDSRGRAVAYVSADHDLTIFLWTGEPVAYLDDDSVYGFNGKHLGWLKGGVVYDDDGNMVAAMADRFKEPVSSPPPKSFKQFLPFKSFKEFKPFKPFFNSQWSDTPARLFFFHGAQ